MASFNKVMLIGNLTRDPELRVTPKGTSIAQFGIAVNRKFKDESGGDREEVTFVDIEAWGKQAETLAKYCTKGKPLFIEGRLKLDSWDDKATGQKRHKIKVVLEQFQFLGGKDDAPMTEAPAAMPMPMPMPMPRPAPTAYAKPGVDEDVPF